MQTKLSTQRLNLRPLAASDEAAVVAGVGDIAVSGWLSVVPHPYGAADFDAFLNGYARPGETYVVTDRDGFCGVVGIEDGVLGYWFAPGCHGRGYATEAARRVLAEWFSQTDAAVPSGYFRGNDRSAKVLQKLGFVKVGEGLKHCRALSRDRDHIDMILTRDAFVAALPFAATSARLAYRGMIPTDLDAMHEIVRHWDVTRQLGPKWPWPADRSFTKTRVQGFVGNGFVWGVFLSGRLIGTVGVTDGSLGYSLHPDHWGRGLMTESCRTALDRAFADPALAAVTAGVWADNAASQAVLAKLGFKITGETCETSFARPEPSPGYELILTRADWRGA